MDKLKNKFSGCIINLAIGDALGAPFKGISKVEMQSMSKNVLKAYSENNELDLTTGEYTDDTYMSLCTMNSLVTNGYFDVYAISKKFIEWFKKNPKGIGQTTYNSLRAISEGVSYHEASSLYSNEDSADNGAAMRVAPISLFNYNNDIEKLAQNIVDSSLITHSNKDSINGALIIGLLIYFNLHYDNKKDIYNKLIENFDLIHDNQLLDLIKNIPDLTREDLQSDGYIINTLKRTLYHYINYDNPIEAIKSVILLGGDTDTNGSITGSLMGSLYGITDIPEYYIKNLKNYDKILSLIDIMFDISVNDKLYYK